MMKKIIILSVFQCYVWGALIAQPTYLNTQMADIQAYSSYMSTMPINGNNDYTNQLTTNSVLYYQTSEGRWGKMRIEEYGYNLKIEWMTYNPDNSVFSNGYNLIIRGTYFCDLDYRGETSVSADFWWEQKTDIIRNFLPRNSARFYKVNYTAKAKKPKSEVATQTNTSDGIVGSKWLFKETSGMAISFELTFKGDGTALLQGTNTPINDILKWSGNADGIWIGGDFGTGNTINMKGSLNSGILNYSTAHLINGKSGGQNGQYQATKIQSAPELPKTKEQRQAENVETGIKIVGGLVDAIGKKKSEKAKASEAPQTQTADPQPTAPQTKGKKETKNQVKGEPATEVTFSATVVWQPPLSNGSTSTAQTVELKACVEVPETVKEYTLVQNGLRLSIPRGLIARKSNDCINLFSQQVSLKLGENKFQLLVTTNAEQLTSQPFLIYFDPNSVNTSQTTPPQYADKKTRRLALVIGNADYLNGNVLKNPVNDATDMANALKEIGFDVITATNTNLRKMNETLDEFGAKLKNYDIGFFYYAGHGLQVNGENYLVPTDAKPQSQGEVAYECVPIGKLLAKMEDVSNRANIIVLDACRDNPLKRSWSRSTGGSGLANMNAPSGTFIGFATAAGSTAADGTGRNGIFTSALLQHIKVPNQSLDQLFNSVARTVKTMTNNQQIPWTTKSITEDLFLTR